MAKQQIKKAVIPAGGLGTRFLPATKAMAKEIIPILDKPSIQFIVEEAIESGIEEILIITGRNKRSVEDHFDANFDLEDNLKQKHKDKLLKMVEHTSLLNIQFKRQHYPKGLGDAIFQAKSFVGDEPFLLLLGDDIVVNAPGEKPLSKQMMDCYDRYNTSILGVQEVPNRDVNKYGIVDGKHIENRIYKVKGLVEKPAKEEAPSNIAILGRYIINPAIFDILEHTKPGKGGEIQLTDGLKELANIENMYAYAFEGKRYDVGNKLGFLEATVEFALRRDNLRNEFIKYLKEVVKELD